MGNEVVKDIKAPDTTQQNTNNVSQLNPNNVSEQKPDNASQQKPNNVSQQKPDNASQQKPNNVSQQKPDNASQQKPKNVFQQKSDASSQQDNLMRPSNHRAPRSKSRHRGSSAKGGLMKNLNDFLKACDDFENALKIVQICPESESLVEQRLLTIHKILIEKMSTSQKSNDDDSTKKKNKKENSSNLRSGNKSLSSSTSSLHSKISSKGLPKSYTEFLKEVNCPFCEERQNDKYYLIKHLDEDCLPFKTKSFKIKTTMPYSYFQILPKNNFKCNVCHDVVIKSLQGYFDHLNSWNHEENLKIKRNLKQYSDYLFCSVCKFLVPNNCTELIMHLEHQQHTKRSQKLVNEKIFKNKKISCVYYKNREYYCFVCLKKFNKRNNLKDFMEHVIEYEHTLNLEKHRIDATQVYCEICDIEINGFEIWAHFRSLEHESKVLNQKVTQYYTLCVYCSSDFSDLTELSNHMRKGCKEMEISRNDGLISGYEAAGKSSEIVKGVAGKEEVKDGHSLFFDVSDDVDISDLKNYFENFGRVISLNKVIGNKLRIVFKERDTVNKILNFKEVICVNNKMSLTLGESSLEKVENQSNQSESDEENGPSDDDSSSNADEQMENLFQEVGYHLLDNVETMDSAEEDEILLMSKMTLKGTVTLSGFRGCQIFVPNEGRLNLHCRFENHTYNSVLEDLVINQNIKRIEKDSMQFLFGLSQVAMPLIEKSPFWEQVECIVSPIPYVKCIHKRTRKSCIISFADSDKELTNALSACIRENDFIKPFLLTLKLWMSCQKTFLSNIEYPLVALVLFFLRSKSLVRPFLVPEYPVHSKILRSLSDDNDLNDKKPSKNIAGREITKLFQMFLDFLKTFDFKKYAICFPIPRPVPREILANILKDKDYSYCSVWIMNTSCTWNYTADVREKEIISFLNLVDKTLKEM